MKKNGMDSSIKGRISIADKLRIPYVSNSNQNPTAKMNIALLAAIKKMATLEIKTSVVDWLNRKEMDSSVKARIKLAQELRVPYVRKASIRPTAKMNLNLLKALKSNYRVHQAKKVIVVEKIEVLVTTEKDIVTEKIPPSPTEQAPNLTTTSPKPDMVPTSEASVSVTETRVIIPAVPIQRSDNADRTDQKIITNKVPPTLSQTPSPNPTLKLPEPEADSATVSPLIVLVQTNNTPPFWQYWPFIILIAIIASLIYLDKIVRKHRIQR